MDAVGALASIIAVVELAAKLASVCLEYTRSVKHASDNIVRLHAALKQLQEVFENARQVTQTLDASKVQSTKKISETSEECLSKLNQLLQKLRPGSRKKLAAKFNLLKWPLERKEVENEIKQLESFGSRLTLALQVDSITIIDSLDTKFVLSKLAWASGASFDAFDESEELNSTCLEDTRVDVLDQIRKHIYDPQSKSIFWLNGMAGTGKSTISRTLAKEFQEKHQLGANFFFKQGEGDRGNASRFFTTIASQLVQSEPLLVPLVKKALEEDPSLVNKAIGVQFEKLIRLPLMAIKRQSNEPLLIIIDALDECKTTQSSSASQIPTIISLFAQLRGPELTWIKFFMTSRPETYPRDGFLKQNSTSYQELTLDNVPEITTQHDINRFLNWRFRQIRDTHSDDVPPEWPGSDAIDRLTVIAQPLFICAATICRFIGDRNHDPEARLLSVLSNQDYQAMDGVHKTYRPILESMLDESTELEKPVILADFREIVGSIVTFAEPLSVGSMAALLGIPSRRINLRLSRLRSVLKLPEDQTKPVRILHLSFADFLLDPHRRNDHGFWVDAQLTHRNLAQKCLGLLLQTPHLKHNICELTEPGFSRKDIDPLKIQTQLPLEVQYACQYWIVHLDKARDLDPRLDQQVQTFFQQRYLFWLEALALLGKIFEAIGFISTLLKIFGNGENSLLLTLLEDAQRFTWSNAFIADTAPLQLYSSALAFAPQLSCTRMNFSAYIPSWLTRLPRMPDYSDGVRQIPTRDAYGAPWLAISSDNKLLASASSERGYPIEIWDLESGLLRQDFPSCTIWEGFYKVKFSPDGRKLASLGRGHNRNEMVIQLWDIESGQLIKSVDMNLDKSRRLYSEILFSIDGQLSTIKIQANRLILFEPFSGKSLRSFELESNENATSNSWALNVLISSKVKYVVLNGISGVIRLLDVDSGKLLWMHQRASPLDHDRTLFAFSPDEKYLAYSTPKDIRICLVGDGSIISQISNRDFQLADILFSHDEKLVISSNSHRSLRLYNVMSGELELFLAVKPPKLDSMCVSGKLVAVSAAGMATIFDLASKELMNSYIRNNHPVTDVSFASHGNLVCSRSAGSVRIWNTLSEQVEHDFDDRLGSERCENALFSHDSRLVALQTLFNLYVCEVDSGALRWTYSSKGTVLQVAATSRPGLTGIAFAPNGEFFAASFEDNNVEIWNTNTWLLQNNFPVGSHQIATLLFSPDNKFLATASHTINLWQWRSGEIQQTMTVPHRLSRFDATLMAFSPNSKMIAASAWPDSICIWDLQSGSILQTITCFTNYINTLAFHSDGPQLVTNIETFGLSEDIAWEHAPAGLKRTKLVLQGGWICMDKQRIIWIPPIYRNTIDQYNNLIAIGLTSGAVTFMEICLDR